MNCSLLSSRQTTRTTMDARSCERSVLGSSVNKGQQTNPTIQIVLDSQPLQRFWATLPTTQKRINQRYNYHTSILEILTTKRPISIPTMSLRIRCPNCKRNMSGKHSLCKDCRGSSSKQTIVYVVEPGARIEVTTGSSRSSSSRHGESRRAAHNSTGHASGHRAAPAESYRGVADRSSTYVRPRVHPYSDVYEYVPAGVQYVHPSHGGGYPMGAEQHYAYPSHAEYQQYHSEGYPGGYQPSQGPAQQDRGQGNQVQYVYSGTEGPDGEIID